MRQAPDAAAVPGADAAAEPATDPAACRRRVLDALIAVLRGFAVDPRFYAAFEGGSVASGRADAYSDIDLYVVADPALNEPLFAAIEATLKAIDAIRHVWPVADVPWPGFAQKFYLLADAPPFFAVDCALLVPQTALQFLEVERHGHAQVLLDPRCWLQPQRLDRATHDAWRQRRQAQNLAAWPVYRMLVDKEIARSRVWTPSASTRRCRACWSRRPACCTGPTVSTTAGATCTTTGRHRCRRASPDSPTSVTSARWHNA
jgi:hypothetical protein